MKLDQSILANLANTTVNLDLCQSIKSKREPYVQCPHRIKLGDYCGVHARSGQIQRLDQLLIKVKDLLPVAQTVSTSTTTTRSYYTYPDLLRSDIDSQSVFDSLIFYNLKTSGSLNEQIERLKNYLEPNYKKELFNSAGPARLDRTICQNETDFFQLDSLSEVPDYLFFSFQEANDEQRIYACDIRSFHKYLETAKNQTELIVNPYNRQPLKKSTRADYDLKLAFLKRYHGQTSLEWPQIPLSDEQNFKLRTLDVFQIMYGFDYAVDHNWFLRLNRRDLLAYYDLLQDIWNYRLQLTLNEKLLIVPDQPDIFNVNELNLLRNQSFEFIREVLLKKMESMVTKGKTVNDCKNGAMYLLIGLVEICPEAAENLPFLAFSAGMV